MKKFALLIVLMLGACAASEEQYKRNMESLVGTPEASLRQQWGPPDQSYTRGDTEYLIYWRTRQGGGATGAGLSTGPSYFASNTSGAPQTGTSGGATGGGGKAKSCKTTFTVSNATVRTWHAEGNGCKA